MQVKSFQERGFVLGNRVLSDDEADHLFQILDDIVRRPENPYHERVYDFAHGERPFLHIKNMWKRYDEFDRLHSSPAILRALKQLSGIDRFHLWQDRFFYKPAGSGSFHPWHQDSVYLPFLEPYTAISAWVALTDANEETGAMSMVPGSHRWGDAEAFLAEHGGRAAEGNSLPSTYQEHPVSVELCPVSKGFVHFHDGWTWHGSGPNWSSRVRCALGMFFVGADVRFDGFNRWSKDYEGVHGETLPSEHYPYVECPPSA